MEWNAEEPDCDIGNTEVGDEEVRDSVHAAVLDDDQNDESVADDRDDRDGTVKDGQKGDQTRRYVEQRIG